MSENTVVTSSLKMESSSLSQVSGSIKPRLKDVITTGAVFKCTHNDFSHHFGGEPKNPVSVDVICLGTHGTVTGKFYLLQSIQPSLITGKVQKYNFSKRKIHSGKVDHHFTHTGHVRIPPYMKEVILEPVIDQAPVSSSLPESSSLEVVSPVTGSSVPVIDTP